MEVREALEEYQDTRRRMVQPKTLSEAQRILSSFCDFCESQCIQLEQIKPKTVDAYLDVFQVTHHSKAGGSLSTHTVFLHNTILKAFLNWCSQEEEFETLIKPSMVQRIHNPRRSILMRDTFNKQQIFALLGACEVVDVGSEKVNAFLRARDRAIVLLLLDTGIRSAELRGLRMNQVFLSPDDPFIRVMGKGSKEREIGLGEKTRTELEHFVETYHKDEKGTDAFLFTSRHHACLSESALFEIIGRLGRQAGIEGVRCSPHTFRHTYSCMFMRASNDIFRLSRLLGHSSVKITETYLKSFSQSDARRGAPSPVCEIF
jgi:site-specific recombinase XerD